MANQTPNLEALYKAAANAFAKHDRALQAVAPYEKAAQVHHLTSAPRALSKREYTMRFEAETALLALARAISKVKNPSRRDAFVLDYARSRNPTLRAIEITEMDELDEPQAYSLTDEGPIVTYDTKDPALKGRDEIYSSVDARPATLARLSAVKKMRPLLTAVLKGEEPVTVKLSKE